MTLPDQPRLDTLSASDTPPVPTVANGDDVRPWDGFDEDDYERAS